MVWAVLIAAGVLETAWAIALKESEGFTRAVPTAVFAITAPASVALLSVALRQLDVSVGYAVWTGTGAIGAALVGMTLLGEPATAGRVLPIALVTVGIVWLSLAE